MLITSSWRSLAYASSRARGRLYSTRRRLCRQSGKGRLCARLEGRLHDDPLDPWQQGRHGFPPIGGGLLPLALLFIRGRVHQRQRRGEALLLAQPVVLIVTIEARLPSALPLFRPGRNSWEGQKCENLGIE
jgi:hypothetical protein